VRDNSEQEISRVKTYTRRLVLCALALAPAAAVFAAAPQEAPKTRNIVYVMADGLRWQEVFNGADLALIETKDAKPEEVKAFKAAAWRETPEARRELLMPFFWSVIARQGQLYGNRSKGSEAYVTNGHNFSYPGYSETLCGFADARVDSNDKIPNPNVTVLEWLHNKPAFKSRVAAFGAWDTFPAIINAGRAGFPVVAGYDPLTVAPVTPAIEMLNLVKADTTQLWGGEPFDVLPFRTAIEYLKVHKPRILYLSLGETDEWAHSGDYRHYLEAAHRSDAYIRTFWELLQSMPEYRGSTTLIVSTDHGRGLAPEEWRGHGEKIPESKYIWMGFLGPDTPALGERSAIAPVTQSQIAATLAALVGEDYVAAVPKAGKPIQDAIGRP
jgi:hypothetical protein